MLNIFYFQVILSQARVVVLQSKKTRLFTRHVTTATAVKDKETSKEQDTSKQQVAVVQEEEDGYR